MLWQHRGVEEATWERKDVMRATYPSLFEDEGMLFSHLKKKILLHMHVIICICVCAFRDEILRVEECKTRVNLNFSKNKMVKHDDLAATIKVENLEFF